MNSGNIENKGNNICRYCEHIVSTDSKGMAVKHEIFSLLKRWFVRCDGVGKETEFRPLTQEQPKRFWFDK